MKRIVFLSAMMVLCATFVAAAVKVDFTIKPSFDNDYYDYDEAGLIPSFEVGVSVMPQLDLVGRMALYYDGWKYENDSKESWMIVVPGLGARYTFWENKNINTYAFGLYSFPIFRENGKPYDYYKTGFFDLGLGGVCRLNENYALIGETGVRRTSYAYTDYEKGAYYQSKSSVGIRFYF